MVKQTTKQIGDAGEGLAEAYLKDLGYEFIERNYRTRFGEVDLIFLDGEALVFVEVKAKASNRFGAPGEMITAKKLGKITKTAQQYITEHELGDIAWRIDAVLIEGESIEHLQSLT